MNQPKYPIRYVNTLQQYNQTDYIDSNCVEISFLNNGTQNVLLNNTYTLLPGDFIAFDGKQGELDITKYNIVFTGAGIPSCIIAKKTYVDYNDL